SHGAGGRRAGKGVRGILYDGPEKIRSNAQCEGDERDGCDLHPGEPGAAGGDPWPWQSETSIRGPGDRPGPGEKNSIGTFMNALKDILYKVGLEAVIGDTH